MKKDTEINISISNINDGANINSSHLKWVGLIAGREVCIAMGLRVSHVVGHDKRSLPNGVHALVVYMNIYVAIK